MGVFLVRVTGTGSIERLGTEQARKTDEVERHFRRPVWAKNLLECPQIRLSTPAFRTSTQGFATCQNAMMTTINDTFSQEEAYSLLHPLATCRDNQHRMSAPGWSRSRWRGNGIQDQQHPGREPMDNIVIFESGDQPVQVRLEGETVWLSLQQLAELFQRDKSVISRHLRNIYATQELNREATVAKNATVQMEGGREVQRVIAHELLVSLRENVSVDWAHRESARARLRVLVKRILRKYGYPPDLQDAAVQTVLQQAEVLSASWQPGHSGV